MEEMVETQTGKKIKTLRSDNVSTSQILFSKSVRRKG
jgi:hypothetical protein